MTCQNPKIVTSTNSAVSQFGFQTTFKPRSGEILFDISGNTLISNNALTTGINFEVTKPNGQVLGAIDFPTVDINTTNALNTIYTLTGLPKDNEFFGDYHIKAVFKNGVDLYTIEQDVNVCSPSAVNRANFAEGRMSIDVNCASLTAVVKDTADYTFNNQQPISKVYSLGITAPSTAIQLVTSVPYSYDYVGKLTGRYDFELLSKVKYSLGCLVLLEIEYASATQEQITCNNKIGDLICCWKESLDAVKLGGARGEALDEKMKSIYGVYIGALGKALVGEDVTKDVQLIRDELGCDCKCNNTSNIMQRNPIIYNDATTQFVESCGTKLIDNGDGTTTIHSYKYKFKKGDVNDTALVFETSVLTDCVETTTLTINYEAFVNNFINALATNSTLLQSFQSVLNISTIVQDAVANNSAINIDWNCLPKPTYTYTNGIIESINTNQFVNTTINGILYVTPSPIVQTDVSAINTWLNSLGLGAITFYANPVPLIPQNSIVGIISTNENTINSWGLMDSTGYVDSIPMVSNSGTVESQIQHLVNQMCANLNVGTTPCELAIDRSHRALVNVTDDIGLGTISFRVDTTELAPLGAGEHYNIRITSMVGGNEYNYINEVVTQDIHNWSFTYKSLESTPPLNTLKYYISKNCTCCNGGVSTEEEIASSDIEYVQFNTNMGGSGTVVCQPTLSVASITGTSALFSISNGNGSTAAIYYLCDSSGNPLSSLAGTTGMSLLYTSLTGNTTYYVKAQLQTGTCIGTWTNLIAFTTAGAIAFIRTINASAINNTNYPTMGSVDNMCILGNGFTMNIYKSTNTPIATGDILYTNIGLTTPLSGKYVVRDSGSNQMFSIHPTTGVVGSLVYSC